MPNDEVKIVESIKIETTVIVETGLWKRVNDRMTSNLRDLTSKKNNYNTSVLKGVLKCNKCGLKLNRKHRETNHYYGRCAECKWKRI